MGVLRNSLGKRRSGMESIIIAETERLILRRYKKEDLQDLIAAFTVFNGPAAAGESTS